MDKIRVYNPRKYDIGLVLQSGMERVIHPGSFTPMARDDIEYAIEQYVADMNDELYDKIADGNDRFLRDHQHFEDDMKSAVSQLETMLFGN